MEILTIVGLYLVEASYIPQLWRLYKLKEADEFSFLFPGLNIIGRLCGVIASIHSHNATFGWFFFVGIILRLTLLSEVCFYRLRARRRLAAQGVLA